MRTPIRALWLEYRVAKQFPRLWDAVVENVDFVRFRESQDRLPDQGDLGFVTLFSFDSQAAADWMAQVDVPSWFRVREFGLGPGARYYTFPPDLRAQNRRRMRTYLASLKQLAKARRILAVKRSA